MIKASPIRGGIELMSYKRNRTIALIKVSERHVNILPLDPSSLHDHSFLLDISQFS